MNDDNIIGMACVPPGAPDTRPGVNFQQAARQTADERLGENIDHSEVDDTDGNVGA